MSKQNADNSFVRGFIVGGLIGTVTGMLFTSDNRVKTRRILNKSTQALPELAEDLYDTLELQTFRLSKLAAQKWDRFKDAVAIGIAASRSDLPETEPENTEKQNHS